jgi:very-short-patch-repair endonuclease
VALNITAVVEIKKLPKLNSGEANFLFQCNAFKLPKVESQFQFAKPMGRRFTADFAFLEYELLIEINGGIWRAGGGAHSHPSNLARDLEKHQYAARLGFLVLPFTPEQVKSGYAVDWTMQTLYKLGWRPTT